MKKSAVLFFFILVLLLLGCSNQKNNETSNTVVGDASQNQSETELDSIYAEPTPIPVVQVTADDPVAAVANTSGLWGYVNTKGDFRMSSATMSASSVCCFASKSNAA